MGESAVEIAKKVSDFEEFFARVLEKGEEALNQTPELLPVLKKAGVVDAGGKGLITIFTGWQRALLGDEDLEIVFEEVIIPTEEEVQANLSELAEIEFGYCTEFMIINLHKKTTTADIDKLREKLMNIGDSVLCIGDLLQVKVHVHTNEPNKALGYALALGELFNIKIENMLEQNRELKKKAAMMNLDIKQNGMVSVAPGKGIAEVFKDLTVDSIIEGGQTMNPSASDVANAVEKVSAKNVFVFPNNKNIILAAEQAKGLTSKNLIVIPTKSIPEGISAALAFNPDASVEENVDAMTAAISSVKSGLVTYAVRDTHVDGFDLSVGEIIGLDDKTILSKGILVAPTCENLIEKMMTDNVVNITLFFGEDVREEEANNFGDKLAKKYPDCEVTVLYGGNLFTITLFP